jgi:hypothetical protein
MCTAFEHPLLATRSRRAGGGFCAATSSVHSISKPFSGLVNYAREPMDGQFSYVRSVRPGAGRMGDAVVQLVHIQKSGDLV